MTLDEFIDALPRDGWFLWHRGLLRHPSTTNPCGACPIVAAARGEWFNLQWAEAAESMGLGRDLARQIVRAADNTQPYFEGPPESGHDPALRARLLAACGLSEP